MRGRDLSSQMLPLSQVYNGVGISKGIAIGYGYFVESEMTEVEEYSVLEENLQEEVERFEGAIDKSRQQFRQLQKKTFEGLSEADTSEFGVLLEAYLSMLDGSRLIRGVRRRILDLRQNVEYAIREEVKSLEDFFTRTEDIYISARVLDIQELGHRLLRNLVSQSYYHLSEFPEGSILLTKQLSFADALLLDSGRIIGVVAALGGAESHMGIIMRSRGVPMVAGVVDLIKRSYYDGCLMVVDGFTGCVIINPDEETKRDYQRRHTRLLSVQRQLRDRSQLPSVTRDGVEITVQGNLDIDSDLGEALDLGMRGIGLLRTELYYMNRETLPDEEEQYQRMRRVIEGVKGVVTIRTLDVDTEKLSYVLQDYLKDVRNPALSLRGIRLGLRVRELLEIQLSAILRASVHGEVRILLPMVSTVEEVWQVREILRRVAGNLLRRGELFADPLPALGVMVEVPAAALNTDSLVSVCDFFAIGTNDLTQYTLTIDRSDEQVAMLYNPLHPSVLRLIQFTIQAAKRANIQVSICGEIAGDTYYTGLLLGLGVRELSMTPRKIPEVKDYIRGLWLSEVQRLADEVMLCRDTESIKVILRRFHQGV